MEGLEEDDTAFIDFWVWMFLVGLEMHVLTIINDVQ
jgi:hypothetical protein